LVRNRLLAADNPSGSCSGSSRLALASGIISCLGALSTTPKLSENLSSLLIDRLDTWGKKPEGKGNEASALSALAVLGGLEENIHRGGRVRVADSEEEGTVVNYERGSKDVDVLLDGEASTCSLEESTFLPLVVDLSCSGNPKLVDRVFDVLVQASQRREGQGTMDQALLELFAARSCLTLLSQPANVEACSRRSPLTQYTSHYEHDFTHFFTHNMRCKLSLNAFMHRTCRIQAGLCGCIRSPGSPLSIIGRPGPPLSHYDMLFSFLTSRVCSLFDKHNLPAK
jgi:hypothetical protein